MARWIDDLAVEQVDTDPDGTPHFWSADTNRPSMTRVAWTGDGTPPTGDSVTPRAFEIGLGEAIDPASVDTATATLTPDGGSPVSLTITLAADGRAAYLTGATVQAGTTYTLRVDGLTDTTHNPIWPEDATVTIADPITYEVLQDTTAPKLLAVLDGTDALYLLFDEPVEPAAGYDLGTAVSITRQGQPVEGAADRLTATLLEWQPAGGVGGLIPGGSYTLAALHLTDLNGNAATASATFTHLTTTPNLLHLAYTAPTDTQPLTQSQYGLTTLFQGRTWHPDLGMYHYRARWYLHVIGEFAERDPLGPVDSMNLYQALRWDALNFADPMGEGAVVPGQMPPQPEVPRRRTPEEKTQPKMPLPLLPGVPDIDPSAPLKSRDIGLDGDKYVEADSAVVHEVLGLARYLTDIGTVAVAEKLVHVAERKHFSAGLATGANIAWPEVGVGGSVNLQVFFNEDYYYVGLFGTETWSNAKPEFRATFGTTRAALAPVGAAGVGGFLSPVSVNVARAHYPTPNTPKEWEGPFNSWTVSLGALSGALFWTGGYSTPFSARMRGVEIGLGPGLGVTYMHQYYHAWPVFGPFTDASSTESVVELVLGQWGGGN